MDYYIYRCPYPKNYNAGQYDIFFKQNQGWYYDISSRKYSTLDENTYSYLIGVSKSATSNLAINSLSGCNVKGIFTDFGQPLRLASDDSISIHSSDSDFNYYEYKMSKTTDIVLTIKALYNNTNFTLKVP
ncbi:MAG: hypothetical protein KDK36_11710 [Leptospiraceae bacterium]|nr:hypothetical protein [Leptospiraceae bacterium]